MSRRRNAAIAAALSVLVLGSPLIAGCGAQRNITDEVSNPPADLSSEDTLALNDEIAELTKLIESNPQDADAYNNRGLAKYLLNDYQGAITDYNKAIEINPQYANAYSNRGITKAIEFNDKQGACSDFKKAASLGYEYRIKWLKSEDGAWCRNMR